VLLLLSEAVSNDLAIVLTEEPTRNEAGESDWDDVSDELLKDISLLDSGDLGLFERNELDLLSREKLSAALAVLDE